MVGLANRRITVFNLSNPAAVYKDVESPLKYQTRCVTAFPDQSGYLVGSIEGRVAVHHVEEHLQVFFPTTLLCPCLMSFAQCSTPFAQHFPSLFRLLGVEALMNACTAYT